MRILLEDKPASLKDDQIGKAYDKGWDDSFEGVTKRRVYLDPQLSRAYNIGRFDQEFGQYDAPVLDITSWEKRLKFIKLADL